MGFGYRKSSTYMEYLGAFENANMPMEAFLLKTKNIQITHFLKKIYPSLTVPTHRKAKVKEPEIIIEKPVVKPVVWAPVKLKKAKIHEPKPKKVKAQRKKPEYLNRLNKAQIIARENDLMEKANRNLTPPKIIDVDTERYKPLLNNVNIFSPCAGCRMKPCAPEYCQNLASFLF